mgnify:CR=1 FL=1
MREIVVRSLTSGNRLNRDCLVTEFMRQAGSLTKVVRRCTYHIESRMTVPSIGDSILAARRLDPHPPRQVYVTKDINPDTGGEQVTYKVLGHLYVVMERDVFCIGYRHILSMDIEATEPSCETLVY